MAKRSTDKDYVDNEKLYEEMVKYITSYRAAVADGRQTPQCPDYVARCITLIAENLSTTRNFVYYPFREELIGDGIENTIRYLYNFDPEKTRNPFSYFTQIIYYAFLRRIEKEKKQLYIKHKLFENAVVTTSLMEVSSEDGAHRHASVSKNTYEKMNNIVERFETKKPSAKKKSASTKAAKDGDASE